MEILISVAMILLIVIPSALIVHNCAQTGHFLCYWRFTYESANAKKTALKIAYSHSVVAYFVNLIFLCRKIALRIPSTPFLMQCWVNIWYFVRHFRLKAFNLVICKSNQRKPFRQTSFYARMTIREMGNIANFLEFWIMKLFHLKVESL